MSKKIKYQKDKKNIEDQYNNYIYPKPVSDINLEIINKKIASLADPNYSWHLLWPEKEHQSSKLKILIAGCGSDQAAILAMCNSKHNFYGIDLSKKSIDHQNILKEKHQINNLELFCDDFRNVEFDFKFDYIISSGVIHHLENPITGIKYFKKYIKNDGVICLMVYGDNQSYGLNKVKTLFQYLNLKQDSESINISRNLIYNLPEDHPAKIFTKSVKDLSYDAGVIDLMLHNKEKFFNINELIDILDENNLKIKNFFDARIFSLTKFFLDNDLIINKIRKLTIKKRLEISQNLNWNDRKIELIICKKLKKNKTKFDILEDGLDNLYFYPNRSLNYLIYENKISVEEKFSKKIYNYNFNNYIYLDWKKVLSGKYQLSKIIKKSHHEKEIKRVLTLLLENHHLDLSLLPIEDYEKFYA